MLQTTRSVKSVQTGAPRLTRHLVRVTGYRVGAHKRQSETQNEVKSDINQDNDNEVSSNGLDVEFAERRFAVLGLGSLLASTLLLPSAGDAATTKPAKPDYYQELLNSRGAPDTSSLLKKYEKTKAGPAADVKKPAKTTKPSAPPSRTTSKPARIAGPTNQATPAPAPVNPLAIVVGLVTVGAGVLLGQKGRKGSSADKAGSGPGTRIVKKAATSTPPKRSGQGTLVSRPTQKSSGTLVKKPSPQTPVVGTRIKAAPGSGSGTKVKSAPVGTLKKSASARGAVEKDKGSNVGAVLGLGITALALVGLVSAGNPGKKETPAPRPESVVSARVATPPKSEPQGGETESTSTTTPSLPPPPPAPAPKIETPKTPEPMPTETPKSDLPLAPVTPPKPVPVPVPVPVPAPSSLPSGKAMVPTTASSPVILVGGGILAILALAALTTTTPTGASTAGGEQSPVESAEAAEAKQRAAEARAWIEAWRAKQRQG